MKKSIIMSVSLVSSLLMLSGAALAGGVISASEALKQVKDNQLIIVDVRHPTEWAETGIPKDAKYISVHEKGFLYKLSKHIKGDKTKPIAFICDSGVRSTKVTNFLENNGYTNVYNIKEGMMGSNHGEGWIKSDLPTQQVLPANIPVPTKRVQ